MYDTIKLNLHSLYFSSWKCIALVCIVISRGPNKVQSPIVLGVIHTHTKESMLQKACLWTIKDGRKERFYPHFVEWRHRDPSAVAELSHKLCPCNTFAQQQLLLSQALILIFHRTRDRRSMRLSQPHSGRAGDWPLRKNICATSNLDYY